MSVKKCLRLPDSTFRNKSGNQQITTLVGICPLSNKLVPLPLNDDTDVPGGNGVSVPESDMSSLSGVLELACKEVVVWLQMRRKKRHKYPFLLFNIHLLYTQSEWSKILENWYVFKWRVTSLWLWWFYGYNSSVMYIGFKSFLNWVPVLNLGHQTFRH